jgi:hypothetical protein
MGTEPVYLPGGAADAGAVGTTRTTSSELEGTTSATPPVTHVEPMQSVTRDGGVGDARATGPEPPGASRVSIIPAPDYARNMGLVDAGATPPPPPELLPGAPAPPAYEPYQRSPHVGPPSAADRNSWSGSQWQR